MFYEPWQSRRKKILIAGLAVVAVGLVAAAVFGIWQKRQKAQLKKINEQEAVTVKSPEEKQKEMLDAIRKANEGMQPVSEEEQAKRQQEMLDAINKANEGTKPISQEEAAKKTQDMLKTINEANRK